jgi:UDPglucose 6-dehydrogenase
MHEAAKLLDHVTYCEDAYECAQGADALLIVTEWEQFRALDLPRLKEAMKAPVIIDLRNIYRHDEVANEGFTYHSIGRP